MELFALDIITKEDLEESITRLAYEESNSAIMTEFIKNDIIKITVYGSDDTLSNIKNKINSFIKDFYNCDNIDSFVKYYQYVLENTDWSEKWKSEFNPIELKDIAVTPYFKDYTGNIKRVITINPSVGFGSGEHETTQLMLEKISELNINGKKVLDIGSGSGILSIAAILFGAKEALMIEIDKDAGNNSKENFELNNMLNKFSLIVGDFAESTVREKIKSKYEVILLNILPNIIIKLLPYIDYFLSEKGELIISGVVEERYTEIINSVKNNNFIIKSTAKKNNWIRLDCIKKI
ncbi:MAG: 50S ribosomal protein L11 methyltransferase [bacterium]